MLRRMVLVVRQFILCYLFLVSSVNSCFRLVLILRFFGFVFIHERMLKGIRMIALRLFSIVFGFFLLRQVRAECLWCLISCLEAEGDSSVISIRVGKRERVLQIEVAFWNRVWKDNVFDFLIFGGGVITYLHVYARQYMYFFVMAS